MFIAAILNPETNRKLEGIRECPVAKERGRKTLGFYA